MADEADSGDQSKHALSCLIGRLQILDATATVALFDLRGPQSAPCRFSGGAVGGVGMWDDD